LASGTHTALITVADPNALDAPQIITVTVAVGGAVPSNVNLFVSPDPGARDAVPFTANAVLSSDVNTATGGNWLSLAFQGSGSFAFVVPYSVTAVNPGGLAEGTYNGTIRTTGSPLSDDNKTINVTLRVTAQPILNVEPRSLNMRSAVGAPVQVANLVIGNRGRGTLTLEAPAVAMASGAGWLTASVVAGTTIVQVRANAANLAPGTYRGTVTINGNAANTGVQIPVTFRVSARGNPVVSVGGVVNNATFASNDALARGAIAAVFGDQFRFGDPVAASSLPLQQTLGDVRVLVNDQPAPVYFVSYGQINFQIPYDAREGRGTIVVVSNGQRSNPVTVAIANRAPRLLRLGVENYAIAVNGDGTFPVPRNTVLGAQGRPAREGETLVVYALGLGPTTPGVTSGVAAPSSPLASVVPTPLVQFGLTAGNEVTPLFAGLTPGFVGLYQINVTIPRNIEKGPKVRMLLDFGNNITSNPVDIAIE
jgi:uncharacterized protein (TIGR03437 family)